MAGSAERAKKLKEMRERAKQTDKTVNRAPFAPKDDVKVSPGSKVRKDTKTTPGTTKLNQALTPKKVSPGSKVRKESRDNKATQTKFVQKKTATGDTPKKVSTRGNPLKDRPRTIAEAKKRGEMYFFDSKGVKKLAVTKADLDKTGLSLKEYANKFAKKKQTKKDAEALKPYAIKKRGGGVMKKKSYAGGGAMKKKGMAAGGRNTMKKQMMRGGGMGMMMKKKMMAGGGAMKKKGYAIGGAMKKKGMKRGGKPMKMRGGGLATRGTNFRIR
jgi:hypothetical protein